jgi:hypothetical protein
MASLSLSPLPLPPPSFIKGGNIATWEIKSYHAAAAAPNVFPILFSPFISYGILTAPQEGRKEGRREGGGEGRKEGRKEGSKVARKTFAILAFSGRLFFIMREMLAIGRNRSCSRTSSFSISMDKGRKGGRKERRKEGGVKIMSVSLSAFPIF